MRLVSSGLLTLTCFAFGLSTETATADPLANSGVDDSDFQLQILSNPSRVAEWGNAAGERRLLTGLDLETQSLIDVYIQINSTGLGASASGLNAIALGEEADASGVSAIAIGTRARAPFADSLALGVGAVTQRRNQMMFGRRSSNYTMPGLNSPGSKAAQTGEISLVTTDANGNLASDGGETVAALTQSIEANTKGIANNAYDVSALYELHGLQRDQIASNSEASGSNAAAARKNASDVSALFELDSRQEEQIESNSEAIDKNGSNIRTNSQTLASVEKQVDANTQDIDLLKAGYVGDSTRFADLEAEVENQGQSMLAAEASMAQFDMALESHGAAIGALQTDVSEIRADIGQLTHRLNRQGAEIEENTAGIAIANALAGSTWLQSNEQIAFSMNLGHFDGNTALALSGATRVDRLWSANFAIGSVPEKGDIGARAGLRVGW